MLASHQVVREDELRAALQTILASETFNRSQQLSRLLRYLCEAVLTRDAERLAEHTIGIEALGRPADFDPTEDAAVRVEMHRLRRRLREYYSQEGANDPLRIEIPTGRYAPMVTKVGDAPPAPEESRESEPDPGLPPMRWFSNRTVVFGSIAGLLLVGAAASLAWRGPTRPASFVADAARAAGPITAASPLFGVRIGCGRRQPWTDRLGQIWGADDHFEGGEAIELPAKTYIAGAFDAHLFQSARTGTFTYRIPLLARTYEMRLYFIEPVFGPDVDQGGEGNRLFSLAINGTKVLDRFDILTDADGKWIADVRVFKDITPASDGYVRLEFKTIMGSALINAIEFVPARPHVLNPVRLLPQDNFYTDSAGNLWTPDNYVMGGRVAIHPGPVKNTRDQELFRHERYGRFRYAIPADGGAYSVYIYMSEEYWGPGNPGGGGEGTRVFSAFCNGLPLLRSFDLFKESGTNAGVVRAFHHLTPNAQGKLLLSFEPEHDYASIYALEVLDEAGPDTPSYQRTVRDSGAN